MCFVFVFSFGDAIDDAIGHAKSDASLIQEQEPEPEQDKDKTSTLERDFEEFWKSYPMRNGKRHGKAEALRKFQDFSHEDRQQVLIASSNYANSELVRKGIGIKDPHRFLQNGKGDLAWREWLTPEVVSNGQGQALTCTKRIQGPSDRYIHNCGQPVSPESRPNEPRCAEHLRKENQPSLVDHAAH